MNLTAALPWSRTLLNSLYLRMTPGQRSRFHQRLAKGFRETRLRPRSGRWEIVFAGKRVVMPLTTERFWLDWDNAVSIVGHDIEIKLTYEALIRSRMRPELFLDVGANYGVHSLLFLAHNIPTITFEPNSTCHAYLHETCKLKRLEHIAVGDEAYPAVPGDRHNGPSRRFGGLRGRTNFLGRRLAAIPIWRPIGALLTHRGPKGGIEYPGTAG
jgi:hypothetical protein